MKEPEARFAHARGGKAEGAVVALLQAMHKLAAIMRGGVNGTEERQTKLSAVSVPAENQVADEGFV